MLNFSSIYVFQQEKPKKELHKSVYRRQLSGRQVEVDLLPANE